MGQVEQNSSPEFCLKILKYVYKCAIVQIVQTVYDDVKISKKAVTDNCLGSEEFKRE